MARFDKVARSVSSSNNARLGPSASGREVGGVGAVADRHRLGLRMGSFETGTVAMSIISSEPSESATESVGDKGGCGSGIGLVGLVALSGEGVEGRGRVVVLGQTDRGGLDMASRNEGGG